MGNQNCSQITQLRQQNQSYGDFKIIKQQSKLLAIIQKTLQNDQQLKQQVRQKLQTRLKLKSNHLVKLLKYQITPNKYSTHIQMQYQFLNKTLQDKYRQKTHQQQQFTQRQLFNIIYGTQEALEELNKYQIRHGCINLSTILCQGNFYKITDVSSTTFVKSYDLVRRGCRNQLLSQKLLTNLQYRSLQPYYQLQDDLFSLGMIILCLTNKVTPQYFYLWKEKNCTAQIKWQNVQSCIRKIQKTFSSKLSKKIKQLIGFGDELDKSVDTSSTMVNVGHNISSYQKNHHEHNQHTGTEITQSIKINNNITHDHGNHINNKISQKANTMNHSFNSHSHSLMNSTLNRSLSRGVSNNKNRDKKEILEDRPVNFLLKLPNHNHRTINVKNGQINVSLREEKQEKQKAFISREQFSFFEEKSKDSY